MAIFRKNVHNILFVLSLLIILYGAYRALFGTVEGLGKKQLNKLCADDISQCGYKKYDFNDTSVLKAFRKAVRKEKKDCKQECKEDYELLGYRNKRKCKKQLCKTKTIAAELLVDTIDDDVSDPETTDPETTDNFDENCNSVLNGEYINIIQMDTSLNDPNPPAMLYKQSSDDQNLVKWETKIGNNSMLTRFELTYIINKGSFMLVRGNMGDEPFWSTDLPEDSTLLAGFLKRDGNEGVNQLETDDKGAPIRIAKAFKFTSANVQQGHRNIIFTDITEFGCN